MQVFFGSSKESSELMDEVASWLQAEGVEVLLWTDRRAFPLGQFTLARLIELTRIVDASVFLFAEDDRVWYRDAEEHQPRDNVLFEYGLFASRLGLGRSIVCRVDRPRIATDLLGLTTLNISANNTLDAKLRIRDWVRNCRREIASEGGTDDISSEVKYPELCPHVARKSVQEELEEHLAAFPSWRVVVGKPRGTPPRPTRELARIFKFPSFREAIRFMAIAADEIDQRNHHPRWENVFDQIVVYLSTWNIGHEITPLDIDVARYLEDLYTIRFTPDAAVDEPRRQA